MDAYDVEKIQSFKKLGLHVECIEAYDDTLLVVIQGGQLRKYSVKFMYDIQKDKQRVRLECESFPSTFSKPVTKMMAIPKCSLLIAAYDNMLNVHDLHSYELKSSMTSTKGVSEFDVIAKESMTKNHRFQTRVTAKLCVSVGKRLKLYHLRGDTFEEISTDTVLVSPPKGLLWCKKNLFVGLKNEYFVMKPETDQIHDVFEYGSQQTEPLMTPLDDDMVLLGYSNRSICVNRVGKPVKKTSVVWSGVPLHIVYDRPYLIAVLRRYVEVKSADPSVSVQQMDVKNVECVSQGSGIIYLKTANSIYALTMKPLKERLKAVMQHKHFDLAIQCVNFSDTPAEDKTQEIYKLQTHNGVHLFFLQKFEESMKVFLNINTDPSHVVGMFPDLLPSKLRHSFEYPDKLPQLQGNDLDTALLALIEYLKVKRDQIEELDETLEFLPILIVDKSGKNETLKSKDQALSVIDTTLLKCYLRVNDALIAPLLRTPGNKVHTHVAKKVLRENHKFSELIILYEQEEMHSEALDMIKEQSTKTKSSLYGTAMAVHYLKKLGENHLQLIFEHAKWVIDMDPMDGLKIFIDDHQSPVSELPRGHVRSFLSSYRPELIVPYLEHIIYVWNDMTEEFHDELADQLRDKVIKLYHRSGQYKSKGVKRSAGSTTLEKSRSKMLQFFQFSSVFKPERVLTKFPLDSFFEERAVLLGRMNEHEQALGIYIYILKEVNEAEEYCFKKFREGETDVYLYLLKVYLCPPESSSLGLTSFTDIPQPDINAAISVLETHGRYLDLQKVLDILPEDLPMKKLSMYLDSSLQSRLSRKMMHQVRKNLQIMEFCLIDEKRMDLNKQMILRDEDTTCDECKRKIGKVDSVFAHRPDGSIVHFVCIGEMKTS